MQPYNDRDPKREQIVTMFDRIAPSYDTLNHLLSFNIDRRWRLRVAKLVRKGEPARILDLATGTGDMAIMLVEKIEGVEVVGADPSKGMLEIAKVKVDKKRVADRVTLVVADAEKLPFDDGEFDAVTIAFGIRNFHNITASLREMARVLRPDGELFILEFSTPRNKLFGALYRLYFHKILPIIGGWISKDRDAYRYLPQSVDEFPDVARFTEMISQHGFSECHSRALMTGVAEIYMGKRSKNKNN